MKTVDIALNDLKRSFRSAFALVFMFGVPLLVTALFYFMFGGAGSSGGFAVPKTQVVVANLDQGGPAFEAAMPGNPAGSLGAMIAGALEGPQFANMIVVTRAGTADVARQAVDRQQAGVAILIPADFSQRFFADADHDAPVVPATIELYQDPALTLGPAIVRSVLNSLVDSFSRTKITAAVVVAQLPAHDPAVVAAAVQLDVAAGELPREALVGLHAPASTPQQKDNGLLARMVGGVMAGMLVFYAFFTGTSAAQSILREDEAGTLSRLFTTPTPQTVILTGKLLSVVLTVLVQVVVLLILGRLIFGIAWGGLETLAPVAGGTVLIGSTFGVFANSLLKNTRQSGIIFGGVLTLTGMIGMIKVLTMSVTTSGAIDIASLIVPQGWAVRSFTQSMEGAPLADLAATGLVMLAWSVVFFAAGAWRFQRRYA